MAKKQEDGVLLTYAEWANLEEMLAQSRLIQQGWQALHDGNGQSVAEAVLRVHTMTSLLLAFTIDVLERMIENN